MEEIQPHMAGGQAPVGTQRALLVGGGVGAAPLFMLCQELVGSGVHVDVVLGAQTADALVCLKRYEQLLSRDVRVATDDGTLGREGFCTSLVEEALTKAAGTPVASNP